MSYIISDLWLFIFKTFCSTFSWSLATPDTANGAEHWHPRATHYRCRTSGPTTGYWVRICFLTKTWSNSYAFQTLRSSTLESSLSYFKTIPICSYQLILDASHAPSLFDHTVMIVCSVLPMSGKGIIRVLGWSILNL